MFISARYSNPSTRSPTGRSASRSNFAGSVEFSSSKPFYYFMLHQTPEAVSPHLVKAYFMAWDPCEYDEPAVWDNDLNKLVISYTNYWHDENSWRVGWYSALEIRNNTDELVTYTLDHIPYYWRCNTIQEPGKVVKYKEQVVQLTCEAARGEKIDAHEAVWLGR